MANCFFVQSATGISKIMYFITSITSIHCSCIYVYMCTGCITTVKAAVSESSDDNNQAFGISILTTAMTLGYVIGPAVSGVIADPVQEYNITSSKPLLYMCMYVILVQCTVCSISERVLF